MKDAAPSTVLAPVIGDAELEDALATMRCTWANLARVVDAQGTPPVSSSLKASSKNWWGEIQDATST